MANAMAERFALMNDLERDEVLEFFKSMDFQMGFGLDTEEDEE